MGKTILPLDLLIVLIKYFRGADYFACCDALSLLDKNNKSILIQHIIVIKDYLDFLTRVQDYRCPQILVVLLNNIIKNSSLLDKFVGPSVDIRGLAEKVMFFLRVVYRIDEELRDELKSEEPCTYNSLKKSQYVFVDTLQALSQFVNDEGRLSDSQLPFHEVLEYYNKDELNEFAENKIDSKRQYLEYGKLNGSKVSEMLLARLGNIFKFLQKNGFSFYRIGFYLRFLFRIFYIFG